MATRTPARAGDRIPLTGGLIVQQPFTRSDQVKYQTVRDREGLKRPFRDPVSLFFRGTFRLDNVTPRSEEASAFRVSVAARLVCGRQVNLRRKMVVSPKAALRLTPPEILKRSYSHVRGHRLADRQVEAATTTAVRI